MKQVSIPAAFRNVFGKGESRRLRMKNITPAVLYSGGNDALAIQFDAALLYKSLFDIHSRNAIITLNVEGDDKGERHVLLKEVQKNPVTDKLVHVDFHEIDLNKPVDFKVSLKIKGTAKGVDLGGDLLVSRTSIRLRGCPLDIPDFIEIDVASLGRGDELTFGEISLPDKVEMLDSKKVVFVSVS